MNSNITKSYRMPVTTWSWLHVNQADMTLYGNKEQNQSMIPVVKASKEIQVSFDPSEVESYFKANSDPSRFFLSEEMESFFKESATLFTHIKVPKYHTEREPIFFEYPIPEENHILTDDIFIEALPGSRATIIFSYPEPARKKIIHTGRIRVLIHENAELSIVRPQLFDKDSIHNDVLGAKVLENGTLNIIQTEIGGKDPTASWNIVLEGDRSNANLDVLYAGDGNRRLDFSSRVEHQGKESKSGIHVKGVLNGQSKKTFRDTLDFITGSSGSKGREEESVLMLSPFVRNVSVPLLFCGEDDVEGEHAASSGRPNEDVLFYMMSRGLNQKQAIRLMAEATFTTTLDLIPDDGTKREILNALKYSLEGDDL